MREMKDSGIEWIGEIPGNWKEERLKFLCSITTGNEDTQNANPEGMYPFYVRSPEIEKCDRFTFDGEGILVAGDGAGAGRVFHYATGKYAIHQRVYLLHDIKLDGRYLHYYVSNLFPSLMNFGSAQSTVPSLRLPMLQNFNVVYPSFHIQKDIASFLDSKCAEIDALTADIQKEIEKLQEYRKSVITEAVTKGLDPDVEMKDSGSMYFPYIPKEWELTVLKYQVCSIETGTSLVCSQNATEKGYGILKTSSVTSSVFLPNENKELSDEDISKVSVHVKKNAILVNRKNTPELVGSCAFSNCDYPNLFIPDLIWQVLIMNRMRPKYVYYFLSSSISRQYYGSLATGSSMSMSNISISDFLSIKLPKPPFDVQERIATFLDYSCSEIDSIIADKQKQLETLAEYRKSLIYEYVTGKKEVPEC